MNVLDLFSGIGMYGLGCEWAGMCTVGLVENDPYCNKVLSARFPEVPKWGDIRHVRAEEIRQTCGTEIDLICGGPPCTDISVAGRREGINGKNSSLYWHLWRLAHDLRVPWLIIENSPALRTNGGDTILSSLEGMGYALWPSVVGAGALGSPQKRERVWLVAFNLRFWCERQDGQNKWGMRACDRRQASGQDSGRQSSTEQVGHSQVQSQHLYLRQRRSQQNASLFASGSNERGRTLADCDSNFLWVESGRGGRQSRKEAILLRGNYQTVGNTYSFGECQPPTISSTFTSTRHPRQSAGGAGSRDRAEAVGNSDGPCSRKHSESPGIDGHIVSVSGSGRSGAEDQLANALLERLRERDSSFTERTESQVLSVSGASDAYRKRQKDKHLILHPMGVGLDQYDYEYPRLYSYMGRNKKLLHRLNPSWVSLLQMIPENWLVLDSIKDKNDALKALGNCNSPHVIRIFAEAIMAAEAFLQLQVVNQV